jgi:hypothetical protein
MAINNHFALKNLTFHINHDIKNNAPSIKARGISVIECIASITLLFLTLSLGVSGFQSYQDRALAMDAVRDVTSALNTARFLSLEENRCMRVQLEGNVLLLETRKNGEWSIIRKFPLGMEVGISMNASPVFYPSGFVTPLCSVYLKSLRYTYKITISIAGRIKTILVKDT